MIINDVINHQQMFKRKGKNCCEDLPWLNLKSEKDKQQKQQQKSIQ